FRVASLEIEGNCNNCEIKNMNFASTYVHAQCEAGQTCDSFWGDKDGTVFFGNSAFSHVLIHDNVMQDARACINFFFTANGGDDFQVYNNTISKTDHGITIGGNTANITYGTAKIYNNVFKNFVNWDTGGTTTHVFNH